MSLVLGTVTDEKSSVFRHLRPGGWVEFADFDQDYYSQDDTLKHDSALQRWRQLFQESVQVNGRTLRPGPDLERWLRDAGFVNVGVFKKIVPVGPWPKDPKLVCAFLRPTSSVPTD